MNTDKHRLGFMEKLLDGVEVEWQALGDENIGEFIRGGSFQKKDFTEKGVGCIHYGQIYTHYGIYTDKTKTFISEELAKKCRKAQTGNLIIATTSENDEDVCKAVAWLGDKEIAVSGDACIYMHSLNPKYVSYFFQAEHFQKQKRKHITGAKVRRVNAKNLAKIKIPIPCSDNPKKSLEVQGEIVRILDSFTALTTALTTELNARRKQYNYYRDRLLSFDDLSADYADGRRLGFMEKLLDGVEVEWKALGDVAVKISSGGTPKTGVSEYYGGDIPWLRTQEVNFGEIWNTGIKITELGLENSSAKWIPENCIIIAMYGATVGKIGINKIPMATNQACANIQLDKNITNYRFVFHYLASQYEYIKSLGSGSQTNINAGIVKKLKIPIPCPDNPKKSLEIQGEIVRILDKFDTLAHSITEGLPREIELRQKQYEYYRDLLLSFPKVEASV